MHQTRPYASQIARSSSRVGLLVLVSGGTLGWLAGLCVIEAALSAPRYEPYSRRVDIWTVGGGTRPAGMLDGSYETFVPARFEDGRVYVTAYDDQRLTSGVAFAWDAKTEQVTRVASIPARTPPAGVATTGGAVVYTPLGRVLFGDGHGTWRLFDHGWREVGPLPQAMGRAYPAPTTVDLSDGALLVIAPSDPPAPFYAASVWLAEPGKVAGPELWDHPTFDPALAFAAPDGRVALVAAERAPVLWDPRSQKSEAISGTSPMRAGATGVSLDTSHVLFVGGRSDDRRPNAAWVAFVGALVAWSGLGALAGVALFKRLGRHPDAIALRWYAAGGVLAAVVVPGGALYLLAILLRSLIRPNAFHM